MSVHVLYRTRVTATGGRDGRAVSGNGVLDVALTTPRELGGTGGSGTNPEELFAAGYAACFLSALKYAASQRGLAISDDASVKATVGIGPHAQGGFGLDIQLDIALPGMAPADADALAQSAHLFCAYSNATRNNVAVRLIIT